ncbi:tRNA (guanosine(46)-N7)-methyltransferase TrmB [Spiroplasma floricola]|uniref:tRNA (guanine-N(7)-)-methyltransferase n=1 Tax=Spiroplasma floricola 23-6 TaxID=1336749 RepID=A0A2K8SCF2_9MOLU|nr:tRNA (guanosine(46)-N7)-methyltransferase TrmB [Spiroplasma floricola]AUB31147.1 tRNA (guanine-N(7)-)-methyltransferase [Spiroplasma floricola 23-6]
MRLRNKNWTKNYIEENSKYMINAEKKINIDKLFKKKQDTYLEIGCGKGKFIIEQAIKNKDKNFIAMEKETTVIGVALKKAITTEDFDLTNLLFLNKYAENLLDLFNLNSLNGIFLNFSDPWPKSKSFKKRLTYIDFLNIYWDLLKDNGIIEIKTDNDKLYEFSLEEIAKSKFKLIYNTNNLYSEKELLKDNIATEYEEKFHNLGKNINKIVIKKEV